MSSQHSPQLDHVVIAHPDLTLAVEEFADLTGCVPAYGGPHQGGGTHNALASLGGQIYIELISPDPAQQQDNNLGQRLATYTQGQLLAWAARSSELDSMTGEHRGFRSSRPFDMSRQQPDGAALDWRLLNLTHHKLGGFAPFYIDWLQCPHPATTNPVAGEFESLTICHPDPKLSELVADISSVHCSVGEPSFILSLATARGSVALESTQLDGFWG